MLIQTQRLNAFFDTLSAPFFNRWTKWYIGIDNGLPLEIILRRVGTTGFHDGHFIILLQYALVAWWSNWQFRAVLYYRFFCAHQSGCRDVILQVMAGGFAFVIAPCAVSPKFLCTSIHTNSNVFRRTVLHADTQDVLRIVLTMIP